MVVLRFIVIIFVFSFAIISPSFSKDMFEDFDFEALLKELGGLDDEGEDFSSLFDDKPSEKASPSPSFYEEDSSLKPAPLVQQKPRKIVLKERKAHFLDPFSKETDLDEKGMIINEKKEAFLFYSDKLIDLCSKLVFYLEQYNNLPKVPFKEAALKQSSAKEKKELPTHFLFITKAEEIVRLLPSFWHEGEEAQAIHLTRFFDKQYDKQRQEILNLIDKLSPLVRSIEQRKKTKENEESLVFETSYKKTLTEVIGKAVIPELEKIEKSSLLEVYTFLRGVESGTLKTFETERKKKEDAYKQFSSRQRGASSGGGYGSSWGGGQRGRGSDRFGRYGNDDFGLPYSNDRYRDDGFYSPGKWDSMQDSFPQEKSTDSPTPAEKSSPAPAVSRSKGKEKEKKGILHEFDRGGALYEIIQLLLKLNTPPTSPYAQSLFPSIVGKIVTHEFFPLCVEKLEDASALLAQKKKKILLEGEEQEKEEEKGEEEGERKKQSSKEVNEKEKEKKKKEYEAESKKFVSWCEQLAMPALRLKNAFVSPFDETDSGELGKTYFIPTAYFEKEQSFLREGEFLKTIVDRLEEAVRKGAQRVYGKAQSSYEEYVAEFEKERKEKFSLLLEKRYKWLTSLSQFIQSVRSSFVAASSCGDLTQIVQRTAYVDILKKLADATPLFDSQAAQLFRSYLFLKNDLPTSEEEFGQLYRGNNDENRQLQITIRVGEDAKGFCDALHKIMWGEVCNCVHDYVQERVTSRSFSFFKEARTFMQNHLEMQNEAVAIFENQKKAEEAAYFCLMSLYIFSALTEKATLFGLQTTVFKQCAIDMRELWSLYSSKENKRARTISEMLLSFSTEKIEAVWKIEKEEEELSEQQMKERKEKMEKEQKIYRAAMTAAAKAVEKEQSVSSPPPSPKKSSSIKTKEAKPAPFKDSIATKQMQETPPPSTGGVWRKITSLFGRGWLWGSKQ